MQFNHLMRSREIMFFKKSFASSLLLATVMTLASAPAGAQAANEPASTNPSTTATAADIPAAAHPAAPAAKQAIDNPYGIKALWEQGDFVSKGTLAILFIMSMGSWYILITKLYESMKVAGEAKAARKGFFKHPSLGDATKTLKPESAFRFIAQSGIDANVHHEGALTEHIDRNTWVTMSVQRSVDDVQSRLQDGLAFLATVGSTAPFVGLFGTVWGIYNALTAIGIAGQASIDKVAGPVGEALIMTAIGLAVAVPAVLGYNWLVRRNKVTMEAVRSFSADLHGVLMGARAAR